MKKFVLKIEENGDNFDIEFKNPTISQYWIRRKVNGSWLDNLSDPIFDINFKMSILMDNVPESLKEKIDDLVKEYQNQISIS